jgi:hypothetical protein
MKAPQGRVGGWYREPLLDYYDNVIIALWAITVSCKPSRREQLGKGVWWSIDGFVVEDVLVKREA